MISFTYDPAIERTIFEKHITARKAPPVVQLISDELDRVPFDQASKPVREQTELITTHWQAAEPKFLSVLGRFYQSTLTPATLTCYLTRFDVFPYDYAPTASWFSAPLWGNPAERIHVIMHELCHYYQPQPLPRAIKEAIPTILNDHEAFGMYAIDRGHSDTDEQHWRTIIWDIYQRGGTFDEVQRAARTEPETA